VSVLATFDVTRGAETAAFEEAAAQWAAAHRIVVTKTDAVSGDALARAADDVAALNPLAEIVAFADREHAVAAAFSPLTSNVALPEPPQAALPSGHARIAVRLARPMDVLAYDDLATWLDNLAGALGERLLRLKGLVRVKESEQPILVQSVGTLFSAPRPFGAPQASASQFLVIIARDLQAAELEAVAPTGLFAFSSWSEPSTLPRTAPLSPLETAWL
jgi:G3E family GTPase